MATAEDFSETFNSDLGNYTFGGGWGEWDGSLGFPSVGCAKTTSPNQSTQGQMECTPGGGYEIQTGDSMWFAYRIIGADVLSGAGDVLNIAFFSITNPGFSLSFDDITDPDTGWIIKEIDLSDSIGDLLTSVYCTGWGPCNVYFDTISFSSTSPFVPVVQSTKFYFGQGPGSGALAEKFTLPFNDVAPQAMTLSGVLGTVVIGSREGAGSVTGSSIVYSEYPYSGWIDTADGFSTGTAISTLKWV